MLTVQTTNKSVFLPVLNAQNLANENGTGNNYYNPYYDPYFGLGGGGGYDSYDYYDPFYDPNYEPYFSYFGSGLIYDSGTDTEYDTETGTYYSYDPASGMYYDQETDSYYDPEIDMFYAGTGFGGTRYFVDSVNCYPDAHPKPSEPTVSDPPAPLPPALPPPNPTGTGGTAPTNPPPPPTCPPIEFLDMFTSFDGCCFTYVYFENWGFTYGGCDYNGYLSTFSNSFNCNALMKINNPSYDADFSGKVIYYQDNISSGSQLFDSSRTPSSVYDSSYSNVGSCNGTITGIPCDKGELEVTLQFSVYEFFKGRKIYTAFQNKYQITQKI